MWLIINCLFFIRCVQVFGMEQELSGFDTLCFGSDIHKVFVLKLLSYWYIYGLY